MSPLAWAVVGCELLLETSGAILAYRKRLKILCALLAWRATVDIVTFAVYLLGTDFLTRSVTWGARAVQYAILYALAVQIASKMVAEYGPIWQHVYMILAVAGSLAGYIFAMTDVWAQKFAGADAIMSLTLLGVVLLGWIGRKGRLEEPWRFLTIGLCVASGGNSLCAILAASSSRWWSLYPIPAIAALLMWNLAALKKIPAIWELRRSLGPKVEAEKIESLRFGPQSVGFVESQRARMN